MFRNKWDYWHYYGSAGLSVLIALYCYYWYLSPDMFVVLKVASAYSLGAVSSFLVLTVYEAYEHFMYAVGLSYKSNFWDKYPSWVRDVFSGDTWDSYDMTLNFYGAFLVHLAIYLVKWLRHE